MSAAGFGRRGCRQGATCGLLVKRCVLALSHAPPSAAAISSADRFHAAALLQSASIHCFPAHAICREKVLEVSAMSLNDALEQIENVRGPGLLLLAVPMPLPRPAAGRAQGLGSGAAASLPGSIVQRWCLVAMWLAARCSPAGGPRLFPVQGRGRRRPEGPLPPQVSL